jgi:hypothetical protein
MVEIRELATMNRSTTPPRTVPKSEKATELALSTAIGSLSNPVKYTFAALIPKLKNMLSIPGTNIANTNCPFPVGPSQRAVIAFVASNSKSVRAWPTMVVPTCLAKTLRAIRR